MGNQCPKGLVNDAGLCYDPCKDHYSGVAGVCWSICPDNTVDLGATCVKDTHPRGAGVVPTHCGQGKEKQSGLCYKHCKAGYSGDGPVCWGICPKGYRDDGVDCAKPPSYGRGAGHSSKSGCETSNDKGAKQNGCEKYGSLWYPKCDKGYYNSGCCVCVPDCPAGWNDAGATCTKPSYGRGVGTPVDKCDKGYEYQNGLCYKNCPSGFYGNGPVCWADCPPWTQDDGAVCTKKSYMRGGGSAPPVKTSAWLWILLALIGLAVIGFVMSKILPFFNKGPVNPKTK